MTIDLPEKDFYTKEELSKEWGCNVSDINHLVYDQEKLRLGIRIRDLRFLCDDFLVSTENEIDTCNCDLIRINNRRMSHDIETGDYDCDGIYITNSTKNSTLCRINPDDFNTLEVDENFNYDSFIYINNKLKSKLGMTSPHKIFNIELGGSLSYLIEKEKLENFGISNDPEEYIENRSLIICDYAETFRFEKLTFSAIQAKQCNKNKCHIFSYSSAAVFREHDTFITQEEKKRFEKENVLENITDNNISNKERQSLLKIVIGMAVSKYEYNPNSPRNKATGTNSGSIHADLARIGVSIDNDTIRKYLKEGSELISMGEVK